MKTSSVKKLVQLYKKKLAIHYPDHEIAHIIYLLFEEYMQWPKTRVHLSYDLIVPVKEMRLFNHTLAELLTGKPIQYILGWALFNESKLKVKPGVLIPRPETEELCRMITSDPDLKNRECFSILDIGTGSGCISIDLKKHFPDAAVTGIDSSKIAVDTAVENARDNGCVIDFFNMDIVNPVDGSKLGRFDLIVSNPPYVSESEKKFMHKNVVDFEPANALFVPDNDQLLYYRAIAAFAHGHLLNGGRLYFEINERFGIKISHLVHMFGFEKIEVLRDINEKDRFVRAILKVS